MKKPLVKVDVVESSSKKSKNNSRRKFIKLSGLGIAGSSFLLYGCSEEEFNPGGEVGMPEPEPTPDPDPDPGSEVFDLGSGDVGILNYAFALEQLEAAFYAAVRNGDYYAGANDEEKRIMDDLYNHEVIHREFFKTAITAVAGEENTLPTLEFDVSSIDFNSRDEVLNTALLLENTGVGAYNGAGDRISDSAYLTIAGKIVSVEARHASAIYSLLNPDGGIAASGTIDENGLDLAYDPSEVFDAAGGFIVTEFTADNLPEPMTGA